MCAFGFAAISGEKRLSQALIEIEPCAAGGDFHVVTPAQASDS
jgi:hypothetical protein